MQHCVHSLLVPKVFYLRWVGRLLSHLSWPKLCATFGLVVVGLDLSNDATFLIPPSHTDFLVFSATFTMVSSGSNFKLPKIGQSVSSSLSTCKAFIEFREGYISPFENVIQSQGGYIYIPWPFPPVWGVADNTNRTKSNGGFTPFF